MKRKLLIPAFLLITISCRKSDSIKRIFPGTPQLPTLMSYYTAMTSKTNAAFGISSTSPLNKPVDDNPLVLFEGTFLDNSFRSISGGNIIVDGRSFLPNSNNQYTNNHLDRSVLGKKVVFTFNKPKDFLNTASFGPKDNITTDSLYVPKQLIITNPVANLISIDTIKPGTRFSWNPDVNNADHNLIIAIEYEPGDYANKSISNVYTKRISNVKVINDNGSYELEESLFTGIPVGAEVHFTIGRVNYRLFTDSKDIPFTLFAYACKFGTYLYK